MTKSIRLRGPLNTYSSYGQILIETARFLNQTGLEVTVLPSNTQGALDITYGTKIPDDVAALVNWDTGPSPLDLVIAPVTYRPTQSATIFYTTHESTRLTPQQLENVQRAQHVVVPSRTIADWFAASGVRTTTTIPFGVDPYFFRPTLLPDGPLTFGVVGRFQAKGSRKNLNMVASAFEQAQKDGLQARLLIKCFPDDPIPSLPHNTEVYPFYWNTFQMAEFYSRIHCHVTASSGEGWGLSVHEAAMSMRPSILPIFGAFHDYAYGCGFESIGYSRGPSADPFYMGEVAFPYVADLANAMRFRFSAKHRADIYKSGAAAYNAVRHYTANSMCGALLNLILNTKL